MKGILPKTIDVAHSKLLSTLYGSTGGCLPKENKVNLSVFHDPQREQDIYAWCQNFSLNPVCQILKSACLLS